MPALIKNRKKNSVIIVAALAVSSTVSANPLGLSSTPLAVSGAVDPNVIMMVDTSGSMMQIVEESPYDSDTTYGSCTGGNRLGTSGTYYLSVANDGGAEIYKSGNRYDWGNSGSQKCFRSTYSYRAFLQTLGGSVGSPNGGVGSGSVPGGAGSTYYSGNYLNWYFSNSNQTGPDNFGVGSVRKPNTRDRLDIAKASASDLVDVGGFENVNLGLAGFTFGEGSVCGGCDSKGEIVKGLVPLEDSSAGSHPNRNDVITAIDNLDVDGNTPLAGTLANIGRYFVHGNNASITLTSANAIAENSDSATISAYSLFTTEPIYASGESAPSSTVITESCQKNFVISITDGEPSTDNDYPNILAKWDDNSVSMSSDFDDVAAALFDTDLLPDTEDDINNVITYVIGFKKNSTLLQNAATAGGGEYWTADSASELEASLQNVASDMAERVGSVASVAFNSSQLTAGSAVYQAQFNTARWSGSIFAYPLSDTGVIQAQSWDAADKLDAQSASSRNIMTFTDGVGVEFSWANLNSSQQADLGFDGTFTTDATLGQQVLDYLRGDRSNEGTSAGNFRLRSTALGDVVNSTPVYVGAPELNWPDYASNNLFGASGDDYSTFKSGSAASRDEVLYVGANDGMLHAFDATATSGGGSELFAYIPSILFDASAAATGLHYLADQDYQHKFYVDLTPTVSDVHINTGDGSGDAWHTVLVGGLRGGGKGLFALDITDPSDFSNLGTYADDIMLWEFSSADDADFGYSYSQPTIVMMPNGKWAAIVGNGYNNSGDGHAKLFIIFLEDGVDGSWDSGDYIEIDTGVGDTTTPNGLSTPRVVDTNSDGVADRVYAGDLRGNMWAFDISSTSTGSWDSAYKSGATPHPLFTARDSNGSAQPITTAPMLAQNSNTPTVDGNAPNVIVLFGTGKFLESGDVNSTDKMSFYAVWDKQTANLTRADLEVRNVLSDNSLRTVVGDAIDWSTQEGWFIDLMDRTALANSPVDVGERVVSDPLLRREVLLFNTIIPDDAVCQSGGSGWLMALNYLTGLAPSFAVFDANNDGSIDDSDINFVGSEFLDGIPAKSGLLGDKQYTPGSDGSIAERDIVVGKGSKEGRLSWQELFR